MMPDATGPIQKTAFKTLHQPHGPRSTDLAVSNIQSKIDPSLRREIEASIAAGQQVNRCPITIKAGLTAAQLAHPAELAQFVEWDPVPGHAASNSTERHEVTFRERD